MCKVRQKHELHNVEKMIKNICPRCKATFIHFNEDGWWHGMRCQKCEDEVSEWYQTHKNKRVFAL